LSTFRFELVPSAAKDYRRLDPPIQSRILKALDAIQSDPMSGKPLQGPYQGLRSYRVGEYRIVYRLDARASLVVIQRIGDRRDICC